MLTLKLKTNPNPNANPKQNLTLTLPLTHYIYIFAYPHFTGDFSMCDSGLYQHIFFTLIKFNIFTWEGTPPTEINLRNELNAE